jgi:hypothetical protein
MHSVSLNSYNSGAAATVAAGGAGGVVGVVGVVGIIRHTDYGVTNREWTLNGSEHTLMNFMANRLNIRRDDFDDFTRRYAGIRNYYVRNEYGYEYGSCRSGGGVTTGYHSILDPWNRRFVVFPYEPKRNTGLHSYDVYYSDVIDHGGWSRRQYQTLHNVILLTTSVNGHRVYCVDILEGVYV